MAKQAPTTTNLPPRIDGETDAAYDRRLSAWLRGELCGVH